MFRKKRNQSPQKDTGKKAKSHTLMQEVTAFLTSRYRFRFNVLTEETEVASVENNIPDTHLRYTKVDERWMNTLSMEAIETGIDCWDRDIQRFVRSRRISEYHPFTAYFEQLPRMGRHRPGIRTRPPGVRQPGMGKRFPPLDAGTLRPMDAVPVGCQQRQPR